jgi:heme/copper-type cytochrome/quinol oxidase subunit 2
MTPQSPAAPMFEDMVSFHNHLLRFVILFGVVVIILLYKIFVTFSMETNPILDKCTHFTLLDIVWTLNPSSYFIINFNSSFGIVILRG